MGGNLNEDTGLDQKTTGTTGADPFDTYHYDDSAPESDPRKYSQVDGQEGNQDLDTEDLNGDQQLSTGNHYFQIAVDLGDSRARAKTTRSGRRSSMCAPG